MQTNIVNLRQFYASRLGRKVRRRLRGMVRRQWPAKNGLHMVGLGYTTDLLPLPQASALHDARVVALMPAEQGAIYWPVDDANHSVLADPLRPPFISSSLHRVLVAHHFEFSDEPENLLRAWWQLLVPGGRMMLMVPNHHGLWSRFGGTPFSAGKAYRLAALRGLLNDAGFTLRDVRSALFAPPSSHPIWIGCFNIIEWLGLLFIPRMGGVFIIEAEKQIFAGVRVTGTPVKAKHEWAGATAMQSPRNKP